MEHTTSDRLRWAVQFAAKGWPVIPLHYPKNATECSCGKPHCPSFAKHPMTKNGLKNATKAQSAIMTWWREVPNANIGILTGKESGLVVLDIDPRHGGNESLEALVAEYGELPSTLRVKTGGNGWHYYFTHPGGKLTNKANIRPGIDIRGDGGYVVAPPSLHASQNSYTWASEAKNISELPTWLLELINGKSIAYETKNAETSFEAGSRNASLTSIAGFLQNKGLETSKIQSALEALNCSLCSPPLSELEVKQICKSVDRYAEEQWNNPKLLPSKNIAPSLDQNMLPEALRDWCVDISERMQVCLEFVAGPAIVALSSMIGRKIVIHPKVNDDWKVICNLWGALIAPPSSKKTPALSAVLKPIQSLAVKAREEYVELTKKIEAQKSVAKAEISALKDALKSAVKSGNESVVSEKKATLEKAIKQFEESYVSIEKRYMVNDPTIEKVLAILEENPQGLLLYRDELSGWLETMYKNGREGDREFFLESWNGDSPYSMDRISRGTVFVEGLCLSVIGGLQPTKFNAYVSAITKGGKSDDGFLQRFQMLIYPEKPKAWKHIDRRPNQDAAKWVEQLFERIAQLPFPKGNTSATDRISVRFAPDAQFIADKWYAELEKRLFTETMSPIMEGHLSKFRSLMPSLALIFEVTELLGKTANGVPSSISAESTNLAIRWCEFLELHAIKAYGEHLNPALASARVLYKKITSGAVKDYDRCRDLYRHGWKGLSNMKDLEGAIGVLKTYRWIRVEMISPPTGRRFEVLRLHPSLRVV
ncbi:MAG: DUF3987 domain-containing protein [Oligoflexales bacterium]